MEQKPKRRFKKILIFVVCAIVIIPLLMILLSKPIDIYETKMIAKEYVQNKYGNHYNIRNAVPTYVSPAPFSEQLVELDVTFYDTDGNEPDFTVKVIHDKVRDDSHK